jgi:microcystin-dependent protein
MTTTPIQNDQASLVLNQVVVESGVFPSRDGSGGTGIPMGAIRTFATVNSETTSGTAGAVQPAQGQLLSIQSQQALFSLLGTMYGGNGFNNFGLPNLAGTVTVGAGNGPNGALSNGQTLGQALVTLTNPTLPANIGGGGQPFSNDQPSTTVSYLINVNGGGTGLDVPGMIVPFLGNFAPAGYMMAAGQLLSIVQFQALYATIGNTYGGSKANGTFALPDLQGRTVIGARDPALNIGTAPLGTYVGSANITLTSNNLPLGLGQDQPIDNRQPSLALTYLICTSNGAFLPSSGALAGDIPYLGEIIAFAGTTIPNGWTIASGQLLAINSNQALFASIGTTYGGNGQTNFELPNLVDRDVVGAGTGPNFASAGTTTYAAGTTFGQNSFSLTSAEIPANQAPTVSFTHPVYSVPELGKLELLGTGISIADPGAGNGSETLTISAGGGSFSFSPSFGNGVSISLNAQGAAVITGTVSALNAWLGQTNTSVAEFGYVNADHQTGTETLSFVINDNGNTGFPILTGTGSVTVDITPCYCPGTRIQTARGQKRIEKLKIGDEVMTQSGVARPIKWIGRRSYAGRFALGRKHILPVCIKAGALEDNIPARDLWISPHHAMYLQGVLIEAKDLVNGVSIVQAESIDKVEYIHIELDTHDVIIAEGSLSETFIDDDSRGVFHNAHEYPSLYPDVQQAPARYCAPRCDSGYEVEAARQRIEIRAGLRPASDKNEPLRGYMDKVGPDLIEGWAQNVEHPEAPVCLDIFVGDRMIGQALANRYRADLERAGLGSGRHSFRFAPPKDADIFSDMIQIRRSLDGITIASSKPAKNDVRAA